MFIITNKSYVVKYITRNATVQDDIIRLDGFNVLKNDHEIFEMDNDRFYESQLLVEKYCYDGSTISANPNYVDNAAMNEETKKKVQENADRLELAEDLLLEMMLNGVNS